MPRKELQTSSCYVFPDYTLFKCSLHLAGEEQCAFLWMFYFLSFLLFFLFKTKSRVICLIYLERQYFSPLMGQMKHWKLEHILQLLQVFVFNDSIVSFALFCILASAIMTRLWSYRLVRKSNKPFWQTDWIEAVRSLCFLESCLSFNVCIAYTAYLDLQSHCLHERQYVYLPDVFWIWTLCLQSKHVIWEFAPDK